ncbi:MAG: TIR domain-containing protein, partial [Thalassobium sp.]
NDELEQLRSAVTDNSVLIKSEHFKTSINELFGKYNIQSVVDIASAFEKFDDDIPF